VDVLITLILGVAFCLVAWRPPERDASKKATWWNPDAKGWRATPFRPSTMTERVVRVLMFGFGCLCLVDAVVRVVR